MNRQDDDPDPRTERLHELIAEYLAQEEAGRPPDRDDLFARHPEFAAELELFFEGHDQLKRLGAPDATIPPTDVNEQATEAWSVEAKAVAHGNGERVHPPGTRLRYFGDYELLEEIARGGMGVVYKARQVTLNRVVALKMILAGHLASPDDVKRFHTEAEAAANLQHPNIVAIHEVGEHEGQHYFSMDYVEGRSLADLVRANPPSAKQAAAYVRSIAQAIQYAHEQGTLHRDLKPSNVLIDRHNQPRVTDFGLARRIEGGSDLTNTGQILGTPSYMPPEQAAGNRGQVGPASDVYSLGAILYELVAGRPPFRAETPLETLLQVLGQEPVAPRLLNPKLPRDLETICLKCLRKEQAKRYLSASELAADLGRFLAGEAILARRIGVGERAVKWAKRRPAVAAMIGVTVLALLGSGVAITTHRAAESKRRAETLAESVIVAPAEAMPYALATLRPLGPLALKRLRGHVEFANADRLGQLHAAYALADLGQAPERFLLDAVTTAPDRECRNLVTALEHVKVSALPEIARRAGEISDHVAKVRYAIIALHLGDPTLAMDALAVRSDPILRTTLIHTYAGWHGDLTAVAELLRTNDNAEFRSGLCAAFGTITPDTLEPVDREMAAKALTALFIHAPDGGTHSAAGWALRQWNEKLPEIEAATRPASDRLWFFNGQGMTMVAIPAGKFTMGTPGEGEEYDEKPVHEVSLTQAYYLADREVTVEQFQRFLDDAEYSSAEKPMDWKWEEWMRIYSSTPDCPMNGVTWFETVYYCNWLSAREGRKPCYERSGEKENLKSLGTDSTEAKYDVWRCDFAADGYRLPAEAQWEYAARAGSYADFCFGAPTTRLPEYAWFLNNSDLHSWPGGLKMPSALGLFDMHGNVWEWCWDWQANYGADAVSDPTGYATGVGRVLRGGAFHRFALMCRSSRRNWGPPMDRDHCSGFRVSCGR